MAPPRSEGPINAKAPTEGKEVIAAPGAVEEGQLGDQTLVA